MQKNVCPCHQSSVGTITFQCQKSVSSDAYLLQADNHNYFSGITKAGIYYYSKTNSDVYCEFRMNKLEIQMKDSLHSKQILDCTSVGTHQLNQLKQKRLPLISIILL